jgi:hypothetical protein
MRQPTPEDEARRQAAYDAANARWPLPLNGAETGFLADAAEERQALHSGHASSRPLSEDYERVGLDGEAEFARTYHLPLDLERRPGGDKGIDFVVPLRFTVDVKTARKADYLICEQGKVCADIYVLAEYVDSKAAVLLGWEWGATLARAPVRDFGYGIISHYIPRCALKKMPEFAARLMRLV